MATKSNKPHEMSTEERWNWYHGIDIPESEAKRKAGIMKMLNDPKAAERARKNMALRKKIEEEGRRQQRWADKGSGYEAMSEAGEKRAEAERIRYNKMVDPDWKPSDDTWTGRQKILDNLRKRNTALDPKNDPEMLSTLRNKLNINPTNAEVERRLRARRNARLERDRLSAGESEGAIAGEKAEALRRLRAKELASSRTPQAYDDHRIKSKQRYDKLTSSDLEREADTEKALRDAYLTDRETGQFKDYKRVDEPEEEEGLIAGALRKGREGVDSIKDYLSGATAHKEGAEAAYADHMGMGVDRRLQEAADKKKAPWAKLREDEIAKEEADALINQETTLDSTEMDSEALDDWQQDKGSDVTAKLDAMEALGPDKIEQEGAIDQSEAKPPTTQEEAQQAIYDASPEEQEFIAEEVGRRKGKGKKEWVEVKEATGNYVEYQGSGLVINMAALEKDIKRNENMEMLKHIPEGNRAAMLVEWGYIDRKDLSTMQKKSAKQLKEESLLDLKIANAQLQKEKLSTGLSGEKKVAYDAAHKGMLDAAKNENWELAETYRRQINELSPSSDTTNYSELFEKQVQKNKKLTPKKLFSAAGLKSGEPYYKSRLEVSKAVSFLRTSKGTSSKNLWENPEGLGKMVESGPQAGTTYAQLLKNHGIYSWDKISKEGTDINSRSKAFPNVPKEYLKDEEAYMNWALPSIKNSLLKGIWGTLHTDHERITGEQRKANKEDLAKKVTQYDDTEVASDAETLRGEDSPYQKSVKKKQKAVAKKKSDRVKNLATAIENDKRWKKGVGRTRVEKTADEKKVEYMEEGRKRLDALVKGITIKGKKKALSGYPKFDSAEEVIKYYKDNPDKLQKMSVAFRHFISQK